MNEPKASKLQALVADQIWRSNKTSDRDRLTLDVLAEHREMAEFLELVCEDEPGLSFDGTEAWIVKGRALLSRIRGEVEVTA